jgi:hypothetical protein
MDSSFVTCSGRGLSVSGQPYAFTGVNMYPMLSDGSAERGCGMDMQSGTVLADSLRALGSPSPHGGGQMIRTMFLQRYTVRDGTRCWHAVDTAVAAARAAGFRLLAVLGNQWSHCEIPAGRPAGPHWTPHGDHYMRTARWFRRGYRRDTEPGQLVPYRAWVAEVTERYRDDPTIACWQLMNEPASGPHGLTGGATVLRDFADDVADVVKRHAPRHVVSLGSIGTGQPGMSGSDYTTVHAGPAIDLCEVHDYSPAAVALAGDRWNGLAVRLRQAAELGKPIFVGEFGNALGAPECATPQKRAALYRRKLETYFAHGFVGALAWHWFPSPRADAFGLTPGDPAIAILRAYGGHSQ